MPLTSTLPAVPGGWAVPAVFFDLDGTLVDPAGGITGGIARALSAHEFPVPTKATMDRLVGPPLVVGLRDIIGLPEHLIEPVVETYRSWYTKEGMFASVVYPGIDDALEILGARGLKLAVTTSKPQSTAAMLMDHHGLTEHFAAIVGSPDDEVGLARTDSSKESQVREAARRLDVDPAQVAVVGDRVFDIDAAHSVGALGVGVAWGFAPPGEFAEAGADAVASTPYDLTDFLHAPTQSVPTESSSSVSKETA
ncbi:MAG: HAD hydrolase-like protein [Galactobacter sp.]